MEQESSYRRFTRVELDIEYAIAKDGLNKLFRKIPKEVTLQSKAGGIEVCKRELDVTYGDGCLILESNNFDLFSPEEFSYIIALFGKESFPIFKHKELENKIYFFKKNASEYLETNALIRRN